MIPSTLYQSDKLTLSFELFPPKTEKGEANLYRHVETLMEYQPDFITCTYGAGGSTQTKTLDIICNVKERFDIPVASHLTLVGSTADQLREYLATAKARGVDHIVALRGDPPEGSNEFEQTDGGYRYANELVELLHSEFNDFGVFVAGYPEKHREAPNMETDLDNLKRKVDAGADAIITQLFYCNDDFFRFRDECSSRGINVPVVPGLLPVTDLGQIQRISSLCGAKLPKDFVDALGNTDDQFQVGIDQAVAQIEALKSGGIEGLHLYVLNKSKATVEIMKRMDGLNCPAQAQ
ncbi:methylenetetrahydrofolate reductase [NAD(P)H] [Mariniblastus fucicola]|uniref:Methylenetetrahydrofolate reductase n=1 Tax=Mariniblastus fucicola TaxID=980251 RepID=A0A5B9PSB3_9BACT|nr:methylenetetrahydrofolate reductase [NAD(P)H] [Mariniblastus fucicola]QEG25113.1 5,10-methylenetetrahydrofolate reductase [Mariniblastus fucicola]